MGYMMIYPLVNIEKTMERSTIEIVSFPHEKWVNQRTFDWAMFNSYVTNYQRVPLVEAEAHEKSEALDVWRWIFSAKKVWKWWICWKRCQLRIEMLRQGNLFFSLCHILGSFNHELAGLPPCSGFHWSPHLLFGDFSRSFLSRFSSLKCVHRIMQQQWLRKTRIQEAKSTIAWTMVDVRNE